MHSLPILFFLLTLIQSNKMNDCVKYLSTDGSIRDI